MVEHDHPALRRFQNSFDAGLCPVIGIGLIEHPGPVSYTHLAYFMAVAKLAGMRSKDPNSQVGACIVSSDNKILSKMCIRDRM